MNRRVPDIQFGCLNAQRNRFACDLGVLPHGIPGGVFCLECSEYRGPERETFGQMLSRSVQVDFVISAAPKRRAWWRERIIQIIEAPCGCGSAEKHRGEPTPRTVITRWLFVDWYGTPFPIRWLVPTESRLIGCSCACRFRDWCGEVGII